jgi:hypothetical protein
MNNIILDLETLGNKPGASILSIGGYCLETEETFYKSIDLSSCFKARLNVDADTIAWWMGQSEEARKVFTEKDKVSLSSGLLALSNWIADHKRPVIWGDGANFDCTLLEVAYRHCNLECPWKYFNVRCYRTLKNIFNQFEKPRTGVYHRADDDAKTNGLHLKQILDYIRGLKK